MIERNHNLQLPTADNDFNDYLATTTRAQQASALQFRYGGIRVRYGVTRVRFCILVGFSCNAVALECDSIRDKL